MLIRAKLACRRVDRAERGWNATPATFTGTSANHNLRYSGWQGRARAFAKTTADDCGCSAFTEAWIVQYVRKVIFLRDDEVLEVFLKPVAKKGVSFSCVARNQDVSW